MLSLICEEAGEVKFLEEAKSDGKGKDYFIEGVFLQGNIKNKNGRIYPSNVLENEVNRYVAEKVKDNRAYGELDHPQGPTVSLSHASHLITSLKREGDNFIGRAKILDTPKGKTAKALIEGGANLGVSSRGIGSLRKVEGVDTIQEFINYFTRLKNLMVPRVRKNKGKKK